MASLTQGYASLQHVHLLLASALSCCHLSKAGMHDSGRLLIKVPASDGADAYSCPTWLHFSRALTQ